MKLENNTETPEIIGNENLDAFQFKVDQMHPEIIIKIVADIYKNPRRTVCTEYVQNAIDSMVMAGKEDQPIEIHLPNKFEPYYVVRDYGVSMSHEDVKNIFSYIFRSNKRDSDKLLGGYGLGKLVFSPYSGVMNLTTFFEGYKTIYLLRLDEGEGEITVVSKEASDEPQGVEIKINVPEKDFAYFKETAQNLYRFLNPRPIITGYNEFSFYEKERIIDEPLYCFEKGSSEYYHDKALVTLGHIPFEVDEHSISDLSDKQKFVLRSNVVMYFNVGELDIVPSRDNLNYTQKTCDAIKERVNFIISEMKEKIQNKFKEITNFYEAKCLYYDIFHSRSEANRNLKIFAKVIGKIKITWENHELDNFVEEIDKLYFYRIYSAHQYYSRHTYSSKVRLKSYDLYEDDKYKILINKNLKIVIFDNEISENKNKKKIIHHYKNLETSNIHFCYLMGDFDTFFENHNIPKECFTFVKDLEDPPKQERSYNRGRPTKDKIFVHPDVNARVFFTDSYYNCNLWEEVDDEFDIDDDSEVKVYIPIKYWKPALDGIDKSNIHKIVGILQSKDYTIYGVKTQAMINSIEKKKNWKSFLDVFESIIDEKLAELNIDDVEEWIELSALSKRYLFSRMEITDEYINKFHDNLVRPFLEKVKLFQEKKKEWEHFTNTLEYFHFAPTLKTKYNGIYEKYVDNSQIESKINHIEKIETEIENKYPMICLHDYNYKLEKQQIDYINSIHFYEEQLREEH